MSTNSSHSFRMIKSKVLYSHGTCTSQNETSSQLNKSKKYQQIQSSYSKTNLPQYPQNTKYSQSKLVIVQDNDAAKRFQFFRMRKTSLDKFQNIHSQQAMKIAVTELKNNLQRIRSSKSIH